MFITKHLIDYIALLDRLGVVGDSEMVKRTILVNYCSKCRVYTDGVLVTMAALSFPFGVSGNG